MPFKLALNGVYPNPSRGRITIAFTIPYTGLERLTFSLFDMSGRRVWEHTVGRTLAAGTGSLVWDGVSDKRHAVSSGVYVLRMSAQEKGAKKPREFKTRLTYLR
jgi:hypothetical protein